MSKQSSENFYSLIKDITDNKDFNRLNKELHHGITRYDHSMRVAKWTYQICDKFNIKSINETTRAALLHDFFVDADLADENGVQRLKDHPSKALENSLKYYDLNNVQQDIIKSHMFPCNSIVPKYKESWLVSGIDKVVGAYEMLRFKTSLYMGIYLLFLFEIIRLPR